MALPFALRRPWLLARDLTEDRERPDLERLRAIQDPDRFVWAILPHAARTFSACIAILPAWAARASAVAYLYCRMLDTYEDLVPASDAREAALRAFAARLDPTRGSPIGAAPAIASSTARDARDRAHLLLVERCTLVDAAYARLPADVRAVVGAHARDMAEGMCWSSRTFDEQGGVLRDEEQLARYCRNVLGNPVVFVVRLLRLRRTGSAELPPDVYADAMATGEMIQLANVTRDIEKDLRRGIAYHPALADGLGKDPARDQALAERVREVRAELLRTALSRAPAYRRLVREMAPHAISMARASAVLMMLFTDRYFRACAKRVGITPWSGPNATASLLLRSFPATFSRRWTERVLARIERNFERQAGGFRLEAGGTAAAAGPGDVG